MRHNVDPIELIQRHNPVPDAHRLPDESAASIEALYQEIIGMNHQLTNPTPTGSRERHRSSRRTRRVVILAATLVVATAGVAAAASTLQQPDPEQAATVEDVYSPLVGTVHPLGWRPDLQAEVTNCLLPGSDAFVQEMLAGRPASGFPLQEALTREHLAATCTDDDAYASEHGYTAADATVCIADLGQYIQPTVVIDGTDCAEASPELRPLTDQDLATLNEMRAIEVALLAVPSETGCPTLDGAHQWVQQNLTQLGLDLTVIETDEGPDSCYRGITNWTLGQVWIEPVGPPQS